MSPVLSILLGRIVQVAGNRHRGVSKESGPGSEPGVHSMLRICVALFARQFPVYFANRG